jgi:uncharacterized membrane protein YdbT with pleckstrin-like domain
MPSMPVISCPDCGRDVSTLASACPHCGRPSPAATAPILPSALPLMGKEETKWSGSPAWTLLAERIAALIASAIAIPLLTYLVAGTAESAEQRGGLITIGWLITAALVLFLGISIATALLLLRATRYTITDQRLLIESGLFSKRVDEIDMRLIDDTLFQQGFIHRVLGIGHVTVMSSDKNTPVFTLRGIRDPRQVRELIRTHSYQASQRQVFTRPT